MRFEDVTEKYESSDAWGVALMATSGTEVFVSRGREVLGVSLQSGESRIVTELRPAPGRKLWITGLHYGGGTLYAQAAEREPSDNMPLTNEYDGVHIVRVDTVSTP